MSERLVTVVLHDVAATTLGACDRVLAAVREVAGAVPVTHLVVPRHHGAPPTAAFHAWLDARAAAGDELALHGLTHRDDGATDAAGAVDRLRRTHYTRGEGEFWSLDAATAEARIAEGLAWFDAHRWPVQGFVAPAWLLGDGARAALAAPALAGRFRYTSTLATVEPLPAGRGEAVRSQSVVYSTSRAWRRALSLAWNAGVARAERGNPLLRVELHPHDADFAPVRRSWQAILGRALADGRRATTVAEALRGLVRSR
jgi:predicted deacetylase